MTHLIDYLEDLRREFDWVSTKLKKLEFCTPCCLSELDGGDGHYCFEED